MSRRRIADRAGRVIMFVNILLLLAGFFAFRYSQTVQAGDGHWSPPASPYLSPYRTYFEPHT
jgi:hypothetical protein